MKNSKYRWNNNSGASIMLALLFFLICTFIGSSVLAAASNNASKYKNIRVTNQDYLTISSMANLIKEDIADKVFTKTYVKVEQVNWIFTPDIPTVPDGLGGVEGTYAEVIDPVVVTKDPGIMVDSNLFSIIKGELEEIFYYNVPSTIIDLLDIVTTLPPMITGLTLSATDHQMVIDQVNNIVIESIEIDGDFNIEVKLHLWKDGLKLYPMAITMPSKILFTPNVMVENEKSPDPTKDKDYFIKTTSEFTAEITWPKDDIVITRE